MSVTTRFIRGLLFILLVVAPVAKAKAAIYQLDGYTIKSIRAVGQYPEAIFSGTVEIYFTVPIGYPAGTKCTSNARVYIDAKHYHLLTTAYLAFSKGRTINFAVDDAMTVRYGSCEITYLDVL